MPAFWTGIGQFSPVASRLHLLFRTNPSSPYRGATLLDYFRPENYRFPREFGTRKLDQPLDGDDSNPLYKPQRNLYFTDWEHWSGNNLPYSQLTPEAVDWAPARDSVYSSDRPSEKDWLAE